MTNICTEMGIEPPEGMPCADDDEFERMIEQRRLPAIDAYDALLTRKWLMWLKERNLTSIDGDEIALRSWNYGYVLNFLENARWFNIYRNVKERIELGYDVHIVSDGVAHVVADIGKQKEATQ